MKLHRVRTLRWAGIASLFSVALVAGCTTSPPPGGQTFTFQANQVSAVVAPYDFTANPFDDIANEEPFLIHLGLRLKLNEPVAVVSFVQSTHPNPICTIAEGQTCPGIPGDGATFSGLQLPDLLDLATGSPFEIVGSVEFLMERDALIPIGLVGILQGVTQLINAALPSIIANGGLPSDASGLIAFLGSVLPGVITTVVGFVGQAIGSLIGADQMIGVSPAFFLAVGGTLAGIIRGALPTLLGLVNFALSQQNPNPFPNGLPLIIGVVGDGPRIRYGSATADPFRVYDVDYGWTVS